MKFNAKLRKRLFSFVLAVFMLTANVLPGQMITEVKAAGETKAGEETEVVTLASVREEAAASYNSTEKMGFDLDLSDQEFSGAEGLDYSMDTQDRAYMQVFNNLKERSTEQTIIFRFKTTTASQFLFGTGVDGANNGKNMTFSLQNGTIRCRLRNCNKEQGGTKSGLMGNIGSNLDNGKYHTVAVSFLPELGYAAGNVRFVIDGGEDIYPPSWCPDWKGGFNLNTDNFIRFHIASSALYGADGNNAKFNGIIDFITVINKGYTVQELQQITNADKDYTNFTDMWSSGTCNTWLFTGGTEGVASFTTGGTTRNWVGMFEDTMRSSGSFVERGRFVFNTSKRNADVQQILEEYDTRIAPFGTHVAGIMVGEADYRKGSDGVAEFKESLQALIDKVIEDNKLPLILTPYPSFNQEDASNVSDYTAAILEVAGSKISVIDLSGISEEYIQEDGSLTAAGHQAVANQIKTDLGVTDALKKACTTTYSLNDLADGSYTVAKQTPDGKLAQIKEVTAKTDGINVKAANRLSDTSAQEDVRLEYTLTDSSGTEISGTVPNGESEFEIDGLLKGETYIFRVYDVSRGNVRESYQPVEILIRKGNKGVHREYEDNNISVNETIQALFQSKKPVTYLFMGDSITHGIVTRGYDNVPQMFAKYLDEIGRTDDIVLNTGVSNATIATTLDQIEPRLMRYHPDVVMIMLGTNDVSYRGENVVTNGSASQKGITVQEYKDRYKELVRKIHENNPKSSVVLRVPSEMIVDGPHTGYEEKFASIYEVAEEMKEEFSDLNIAVVNHRQEWLNYKENVRNDNISTTGTCGWLVDNVHPNGRGNLSMFQQIIKELGLYVPTSELANYQYELDAWTDNSAISAPVTQRGREALFEMDALSKYTNELKNVTLTLTANGRTISKTTAYAEDGVLTINSLDSTKEYTVSVTGKDAANSKEISFNAVLTKEAAPMATEEEKQEYTDKLAEAKQETEETMQDYSEEIKNEYQDKLEEIEKQYTQGSLTIEQVDAALAAIRAAQANAQQKYTEAKNTAKTDLATAIERTESVHADGKKDTYIDQNWIDYETAYQNAKNALEAEESLLKQLQNLLTALNNAETKLLNEKKPPESEDTALKLEQGKVYTAGDYSYRILSLSAHTVEVAGAKNTLKKLKIQSNVTIEKESFRVTGIAAFAFRGNKNITQIAILSPVETIGDSAFEKCVNLKKADLKSTGLTKIGKKAFAGCKKLKKILIKSKNLQTVGKQALKKTHNKLKITVPKAKSKTYAKKLAKKGQSKNAVIK